MHEHNVNGHKVDYNNRLSQQKEELMSKLSVVLQGYLKFIRSILVKMELRNAKLGGSPVFNYSLC